MLGKNASFYSGGTGTHDLLLLSADVLTTEVAGVGWLVRVDVAVGSANKYFERCSCVGEMFIQFRFALPNIQYVPTYFPSIQCWANIN